MGQVTTYIYDPAGSRIQTVYGGTGRTISSAYDPLNRLSTVTENARLTTYGYDLNGNVVVKSLPNGDVDTESYDSLNRRTSIATRVNAGRLSEIDFAYDPKGNLLSQQEQYFTQSLTGRVVTNSYDGIDRLLNESVLQGGGTTSTAYSYDNANNRISKIVSGGTSSGSTSYSYNSLNQLTSYSGPGVSVSLTYDADGNRITSGATTYGYDCENRLTDVVEGGIPYHYVYDYRTRRVQRQEGNTTTSLVFSGGNSVQEYENDGTSPSVEYVRGSDWGGGVGGILYTLRGNTLGVTHYNGRGDVVAKTDANGVLTYQASYEAFGRRTQEFGATLDRQKANTKEEDPTGLLLEGFRYRDLETGCFITRDPAGFIDGPNLYTYVNQNPWTKFDPEGLFLFGLYDSASDYDHDVGSVFKGYGGAVGDTVGGTLHVAAHPIQTAEGLGHAIAHPIQTAKAIASTTAQTWNSGLEGKGQVVGNALIAAGIALAPAAEIAGANRLTSAADEIAAAAERAKAAVGDGQGAAYSTKAHSQLGKEIKSLGRDDIHSEVSYKDGDVVPYGTKGSVRVDIAEGSKDAPTTIYDLKTGGAKLTEKRIEQIRQHVPETVKDIKEIR